MAVSEAAVARPRGVLGQYVRASTMVTVSERWSLANIWGCHRRT
jgi:hypothetical protein